MSDSPLLYYESPYLCTLYLLITFTSLGCYLLVIRGLFHTKKLHTSGFLIIASLLTAQSLCLICWHVGGTLPITLHYYNLLPAGGYPHTAGLWVGYTLASGYYAVAVHYVALAFQRYIAIKDITKINLTSAIWKSVAVVIILWVSSFALNLLCLVGECQFFLSPTAFGPTYNFGKSQTMAFLFFNNYIFNVAVVVLPVALYSVAIYKLRGLKSRTNLPRPEVARAEIKLTIHMCIITSFMVMASVMWISANSILPNVEVSQDTAKVVAIIMTLVTSLSFSMDSPILLILHSDLRRSALRGCRRGGEIAPAPLHVS